MSDEQKTRLPDREQLDAMKEQLSQRGKAIAQDLGAKGDEWRKQWDAKSAQWAERGEEIRKQAVERGAEVKDQLNKRSAELKEQATIKGQELKATIDERVKQTSKEIPDVMVESDIVELEPQMDEEISIEDAKLEDVKLGDVTKTKAVRAGAVLATAVTTVGVAALVAGSMIGKKEEEAPLEAYTSGDRKAYFAGGGLASMAGAAYLVRDCNMPGKNITIYEGLNKLGGSNDGAGDAQAGFVCRGGRMLNEETYENFWELFSDIPSLEQDGMSVTDEILNFDHQHPTHAQARLVDQDGNIVDVSSMGFDKEDRRLMTKLLATSETSLDDWTIEEWFTESPHFFTTNFWYMWQTTFAFQKWSSLAEFRRYMNRMIFEFSRIETLEGVTRTRYNQYESVILPLRVYLEEHGVNFVLDTMVTDVDFADDDGITATTIYLADANGTSTVSLEADDLCIVTNGCMTDCATLGDMDTAPVFASELPMSGELWKKLAAKKDVLGNPEPFFNHPEATNWESFTVTCKGDKLLKLIESKTGNIPGSGALMTFKDSSWLMSIVIAAQPHFKAQPMDQTIFWGYGLYTAHNGDYVPRLMRDCTGKEILTELLGHLHLQDKADELMEDVINVIPCMMPYIDAQFQPRKFADRPKVVPEGSTNFAMISQFVEIPDDMVFTEEYSVRAARHAIYSLMNYDRKDICPVTAYNKNPKVLAEAAKTMMR